MLRLLLTNNYKQIKTMKLIVKTLNGKQLPIQIEPEATVGEIKEKIEAEH